MVLTCPECGFELKPYFLESPDYHTCNFCGHEVSAFAFPACFVARKSIAVADLRREEDDASCFYHESKKALQSCSRCGRFLCALCTAEIGADVLCPSCVVSGEKGYSAERAGRDPRLERERTLYDSLALIVAIAPVFTISLSFLGGPAAVYIAIRYWKRPSSIVRRFGWRKWAALALGLAQVGGWAWLIAYLVLRKRPVPV